MKNCVTDEVQSFPREKFILEKPPRCEIDELLADKKTMSPLMPPLLKGYLRMGCKICGEPAYDYEFGTIDYLIMLDMTKLPDRYSKHFNVKMTN